jgi:hypothetical protein
MAGWIGAQRFRFPSNWMRPPGRPAVDAVDQMPDQRERRHQRPTLWKWRRWQLKARKKRGRDWVDGQTTQQEVSGSRLGWKGSPPIARGRRVSDKTDRTSVERSRPGRRREPREASGGTWRDRPRRPARSRGLMRNRTVGRPCVSWAASSAAAATDASCGALLAGALLAQLRCRLTKRSSPLQQRRRARSVCQSSSFSM